MNFTQALEDLAGRPDHDRLRWLCSDANPDDRTRLAYRALVVRLVAGEPEPPDPATAALQAHLARHGCCG